MFFPCIYVCLSCILCKRKAYKQANVECTIDHVLSVFTSVPSSSDDHFNAHQLKTNAEIGEKQTLTTFFERVRSAQSCPLQIRYGGT